MLRDATTFDQGYINIYLFPPIQTPLVFASAVYNMGRGPYLFSFIGD